jgi:transposase, IS5 family
MKAHVGVDSRTKIIHTAVATAANVADTTVLADLLHGEETRVWGDQDYRGQSEVIRECAALAQDHTHRRYRYKNGIDEQERAKNRTKSSVRSKVEHPFQVMKLKFGFVKVRYRGLKKNAHQLFVICGLVNRFSVERSCSWRPAHSWKMPPRAALNEGEGKKPEVEPSFTELLFPEVRHFRDQKCTCSESP